MSVDVFLDTNILLYAASGAATSDAHKRLTARHIMRATNFGVSTQVLQEFYVNAVRKAHMKMAPDVARNWLSGLDERPCLVVDRDVIKLAIRKSIRFKIGYFDAAILAAAEAMGTNTVYSEDLNHAQTYGSVKVLNPFKTI